MAQKEVRKQVSTTETGCGCGNYCHFDPDLRERLIRRLKMVEGQVRGIARMVEEDRHCTEVLTQIGSVQEAMRQVGKLVMRNYLLTCVAQALESEEGSSDEIYDQLMEVIYKFAR